MFGGKKDGELRDDFEKNHFVFSLYCVSKKTKRGWSLEKRCFDAGRAIGNFVKKKFCSRD